MRLTSDKLLTQVPIQAPGAYYCRKIVSHLTIPILLTNNREEYLKNASSDFIYPGDHSHGVQCKGEYLSHL